MGLFKPAWQSNNPKHIPKALAAIEREKSEDTLYEIASKASYDDVRTAAIRRITDPTLLRRLAAQPGTYTRWGEPGRALTERLAACEGSDYLVEVMTSGDTWGGESKRFAIDRLIDALDEEAEPSVKEIYDYFGWLPYAYHQGTSGYGPLKSRLVRALGRVSDHAELCAYLVGGGETYTWDYGEWYEALGRAMGILTNDELEQVIMSDGANDEAKKLAWERLSETLSPDELLRRAEDEGYPLREQACAKAGHVRGEHCVCERCGAHLEHDIVDDTCTHCHGTVETEVEQGPWVRIESYFAIRDAYGHEVVNPCYRDVKTNTYLRFSDGTRELLSTTSVQERNYETL